MRKFQGDLPQTHSHHPTLPVSRGEHHHQQGDTLHKQEDTLHQQGDTLHQQGDIPVLIPKHLVTLNRQLWCCNSQVEPSPGHWCDITQPLPSLFVNTVTLP